MSALASLQQKFQSHILSGSDTQGIAPAVISTPAADNNERLGIYVDGYRSRLIEVLGNDFPGLQVLAGEDTFEELCRDYVNATPSVHYNVRWYGQGLPQFLHDTAPWSDSPVLADMAKFEWALTLSFDAVDEDHVTPAQVQALTPEQWPELGLRLHGSLRRLDLHWNVSAIRRAVDQEEPLPALLAFDAAQTWVTSRRDTTVRFRAVPVDEAAALDAVEQGACFAQLCEALCEWNAEDVVAMRAATLMGQWIADHWVAELLPQA